MKRTNQKNIITTTITIVIVTILGLVMHYKNHHIPEYTLYYISLYSLSNILIHIKWLNIPIIIIRLPYQMIITSCIILNPIIIWIFCQIFIMSTIIYFTILVSTKYEWNFATKVYLSLTLIAIFSRYTNNIYNIFLNYYDSHKKYKNLGSLIHDKNRAHLLIFTIYFILLIITTSTNLSGSQLFKIEHLDYAILQSFATYIAFDRILTTYNTTILKKTFLDIYNEYRKIINIDLGNNKKNKN